MVEKMIGGITFSEETWQKILEGYCEAFTHTSLSIEKEFLLLKEYDDKLKKILDNKEAIYSQLPDSEKQRIEEKFRYFVTYMAYYERIIPGIDFENQEEIDRTYEENFSEFTEFMTSLIYFDEEGNYIEKRTGQKVSRFFPLYIERKPILNQAQNSRIDNINGFLYALDQEHIGPSEIIEINKRVNESNPNREVGYKRVNNVITGSTVDTMRKEEIPNQVAELIYKYDNIDMEIKDPFEEGISDEEKYERIYAICYKEAKFHIAFEHIHPFADGNGRTGRIIMCTNLIRQHIAPPLITDVMLKQYKKYIDDSDCEALAKMIMDSSSQTLSNWVARKRELEGITLEEIIESKKIGR